VEEIVFCAGSMAVLVGLGALGEAARSGRREVRSTPVEARTHTHANWSWLCVSAVLEAIHGALMVRAHEETSDDPSP
jgi:hypothetical protein